jgi:hypothetical protein
MERDGGVSTHARGCRRRVIFDLIREQPLLDLSGGEQHHCLVETQVIWWMLLILMR